MSAWDIHRSVDSAHIMTDLAIELGAQEEAILSATGISPDQLRFPDAVVEARQELRLIANLLEELKSVPGLGVLAGERYHFNAFGALGFALVSSRTLRDAMEIGLKYIQLTFAFSRILLRDSGHRIHIRFEPQDLSARLQQFIVERDCACFVTLQRDMFSRLSPLEAVHFTFDSPANTEAYENFFNLKPKFGMPANELVLNRAQLLERMPQANDLALEAAQAQCEALLNERLQRAGLSAKVRQHLANNAAEMPNMERVAQALNTIPRTLRRRLKQENTSFAELRDEVRQTLAEEYLSGPRLSVEQVAERLGYSGPTSFINAYKRWYGKTPSANRWTTTDSIKPLTPTMKKSRR